MSELSREQRVEAYRSRSQEADELEVSGQHEQTLALLRDSREKARAAGDEDYRLFFDAELINYENPDFARQIQLVEEAHAWAKAQCLPDDSFLLRCQGVYYTFNNQDDEAIAFFNQALAINPRDNNALRDKGASLSRKGDQDGAIAFFDQVLANNPRDNIALCQKGISLSRKGDQDGAIALFDQVLANNPRDNIALCQKGVSLFRKGDQDGASVCFGQALAIKPDDAYSYRCWSVSAFNSGNRDEAFEKIVEAVKREPKQYRKDFFFVCRATKRDPKKEWRTLFPDAEPAEPQSHEDLSGLAGLINQIRDGIGNEKFEQFLEQKRAAEREFTEFLEPDTILDTEVSVLMVLRKWNSFTPVLPTAEDERSRGGGYFIWHKGRGTVIDPGYNFIENFYAAGCRICDIDNVILTHAHNDHTIDFESLCTLFHQYNHSKEGKPRAPKKVRLYLNNGSFLKFSGMLNLKDFDFIEHVTTLNPGGTFKISEDMELRVLGAYHDEVIARDQSVGLDFRIIAGDEPRRILFTGDTGLFPLRKDGADAVAENGPEIWEEYGINEESRPDVMIIHIGSIKENEFKMPLDPQPSSDSKASMKEGPWDACYANHLGVIGTVRLITECLPALAVVSEFGEEMKDFRCDLIRRLTEDVLKPYAKEHNLSEIPSVVPGDLPFIYELGKKNFWCCFCENWRNAKDIAFHEWEEHSTKTIYYYDSLEADDFGKMEKHCIETFDRTRRDHLNMYFRKKHWPKTNS